MMCGMSEAQALDHRRDIGGKTREVQTKSEVWVITTDGSSQMSK